MRIIVDIRMKKRRPKLKDILAKFKNGREINNPRRLEVLRKKIMQLYDENHEVDDVKYHRVSRRWVNASSC